MQLELSPQAQEVIQRRLSSGQFRSADELIEEALNFYDGCHSDEDQPGGPHEISTIEQVREEVQKGLDDIDAGRVAPLDMADIKRELQERLVSKQTD